VNPEGLNVGATIAHRNRARLKNWVIEIMDPLRQAGYMGVDVWRCARRAVSIGTSVMARWSGGTRRDFA